MFMVTECVLLLFSPSAIVTTRPTNRSDQTSDTKEETISNSKMFQPYDDNIRSAAIYVFWFVTLYHRVDSVALEL